MFPILWREKLHRIHKPVSLRQERRPETLSSDSLVLDIGANGGSRVTSKYTELLFWIILIGSMFHLFYFILKIYKQNCITMAITKKSY